MIDKNEKIETTINNLTVTAFTLAFITSGILLTDMIVNHVAFTNSDFIELNRATANEMHSVLGIGSKIISSFTVSSGLTAVALSKTKSKINDFTIKK